MSQFNQPSPNCRPSDRRPQGRRVRGRVRPCFLNVDLEIESATRLDSLAAAMGKGVVVLHSGPASKSKRHMLALESARSFKNPDAAIHALCAVVESLPPPARRVWGRARKEFDVGYEVRPSERSSRFSLRPDTLKRVAKLGATLTVTYYRGDADDASRAPAC